MKIGDIVEFWAYSSVDEGDVHTGTIMAMNGNCAIVKEGARNYSINTNRIF